MRYDCAVSVIPENGYLHGSINGIADHNPEKLLMVGILSRAFLDATGNVEPKYRRSALSWFRTRRSKYLFSYEFIKDYVGLSYSLRTYIETTIQYEIQLEKQRRYAKKNP